MPHQVLAICFLTLLSVATLAFLLWRSIRLRYGFGQWLTHMWAMLLSTFQWSTSVYGRENLPEGGCVLVCNHLSSVDPTFLHRATRYRMARWMVAKEFCEHPWFGVVLRALRAIPTSRGGNDLAAIRATVKYLKAGDAVGVFAEGRLNLTDDPLIPLLPGAVWMAQLARVPIVPCYVSGSVYDRTPWSPFFMGARVIVRIGKPIVLSPEDIKSRSGESLQRISLQCAREMLKLIGQEDFEPVIAEENRLPSREQVRQEQDAWRRKRRHQKPAR